MKNFEKYKTVRERAWMFDRFCEKRLDKVAACAKCELQMTHYDARTGSVCPIAWLELEAEEEKPLPCPFCGGKALVNCGRLLESEGINYWVDCVNPDCMYRSANHTNSEEAIAAHNRLAKAAMDAKKGE